jgi:hypothetical protein
MHIAPAPIPEFLRGARDVVPARGLDTPAALAVAVLGALADLRRGRASFSVPLQPPDAHAYAPGGKGVAAPSAGATTSGTFPVASTPASRSCALSWAVSPSWQSASPARRAHDATLARARSPERCPRSAPLRPACLSPRRMTASPRGPRRVSSPAKALAKKSSCEPIATATCGCETVLESGRAGRQ